RWFCGLASNDAHCVPATTNALRRLRHHQTQHTCKQAEKQIQQRHFFRSIQNDAGQFALKKQFAGNDHQPQ
ncbi:hypothetical protein, partial [Lapidilactobacillus luobeiensis]|uniref:hypothetical protein n=1 Tax=Lapidilactobacillus luobeiensis TaxID=2950371 RepID=UPI0021C2EC60